MDRNVDRAHRRAVARGESEEPRAANVRYNTRTRRIDVELVNGVAISVPVTRLQGLENATTAQLQEGRVRGRGSALRWNALDADVYVPALFRGVLGTPRWMAELGRAGGRATSARKTLASRANGKKGGRPRKLAASRAG
jgi:hypothetical protein